MSVDAATQEPDRLRRKRRDVRAGFFSDRGALLDSRDDLRGVYAFADYLDDAVRWSA